MCEGLIIDLNKDSNGTLKVFLHQVSLSKGRESESAAKVYISPVCVFTWPNSVWLLNFYCRLFQIYIYICFLLLFSNVFVLKIHPQNSLQHMFCGMDQRFFAKIRKTELFLQLGFLSTSAWRSSWKISVHWSVTSCTYKKQINLHMQVPCKAATIQFRILWRNLKGASTMQHVPW